MGLECTNIRLGISRFLAAQLLLNLLFLNFKLKPFLWHFYGIFESDEYFKEIRHFFAVWIKEKGNAAIVKNVCTILDFQVML